jgi:polyhydroxybutyrate depolymerase
MRRILAISLFSFLLNQAIAGTYITSFISHENIDRKVKIYVPDNYDSSKPYPLVITAHGGGYTVDQWIGESKYEPLADTDSFLVVYPEGVATFLFGNAWNVNYGPSENVDDIGFIDKVIELYTSEYNIEEEHIYMSGFSQGGMLSYKYACERPGVLAAIASGSGTMSTNTYFNCENAIPIPVLHMHGTFDFVVPYDGVAGSSTSVNQTINFWRTVNGCNNNPVVTNFPNTHADWIDVIGYDYPCADPNMEVVLHKYVNGGHLWFNIYNDVDNNVESWEFFKRHSTDKTTSSNANTISISDLKVFPIPASEILQIRTFEVPEGQLRIYNSQGSLIKERKALNQMEIDVSDLSEGIYFIQLHLRGERIVRTVAIL